MPKNLQIIEKKLSKPDKSAIPEKYRIPTLWINPDMSEGESVETDPFEFFSNMIKRIYEISEKYPVLLPENDWTHHTVVYNMFIRYTTAYDHNGDGKVSISASKEGFRETGTFLKAIAILPYIHSLGVNTIYLLPVTSIGIDGMKGTLGSPYAIKNHFRLDENLSEPFLKTDVETQFAAFVEAAHLLGMKVITEFVFRTASIDSDLALEHPEWFYWIKADIQNREKADKDENLYGAPHFTKEELKHIETLVHEKNFDNLPAPPVTYRKMFTNIPDKAYQVDEQIRGKTRDGIEVKIPGAFADWPPLDLQPPWSDVTYLKFYNHPDFNYIAYNTVRMYDTRLADETYKVRSLWESICNIIPDYQNKYGIDGVMIDMGHSLPSSLRSEIIRRAREIDPGFVFWEENFSLTDKSLREGYNASLGYTWAVEHERKDMQDMLDKYTNNDIPIPFFLTPETHNTHRAAERKGSCQFNKLAWALNCFIPGILFIHSGFELCETLPVNTGLDFTPKEMKKLPAESLPLFSEGMMNWNNQENITEYMRHIFEIRKRYINPKESFKPDNLKSLKSSNKNVLSFLRKTISPDGDLIIAANYNPKGDEKAKIELPEHSALVRDLLNGFRRRVAKNTLRLELGPMEVFVGFIYYYD